MKPAQDSSDNISHPSRFFEEIHEEGSSDEDKYNIQVGESSFHNMPSRDPNPA